ncbi:putative alpha beta-hydrolase [Rosellinia necatrix]|uniref:Putative alpha beta-hydrolase n=1 Tax=Rosellinia necatrix TaxID=77044 RepID=A0A1W2TLF0_ROSNE|nr:putative alpha beta-hydrolase [Rosellinia necatrix]
MGRLLKDWRYIYVLIVLALYSNPIIRAQFRRDSRDHTVNDGSIPGSAGLWTEWPQITPSEKLKWQPCFGIYGPNLQCARLTVPMDYSRPLNESADHPKVHLALIMATGVGRTGDPSTYAEAPLLINPGGPGGSGVLFTQVKAKSLQLVVGGQHDIIGFDPRGVGASTPKADCFASPDSSNGVLGRNVAYMNRVTWLTGGKEIGLTNSSDVALAKLTARGKAMAKLCQRADAAEGDSSIFRHMNTPNSARDMLSIVHAWDEWRSGSQTMRPIQQEDTGASAEYQMSDNGENSGIGLRGKLMYWGFSYGTLLGATFASMFPKNVGRIILDGVVHADHYTKLIWEGSIVDADAIWDKFFVYCAETKAQCSFYRAGDRPEDIRRRFSETLSSLEEQPAVVLLPDTNLPALVTASDVKKSIFFGGLYAPVAGFPVIADLLDHILNGSLEEIARGEGMALFCGNLTLPVWPDDAMRGVACSDKRRKYNEDATELRRRFEKAGSISWFADVWFGAEPNLGCNGWEIESKDPPLRWDHDPTQKAPLIETSFPILVLSNTLDPVTPLNDALDMTRKFANASIVEQAGLGHCTLSCVSGCTMAHVRAYLNDGVVPPPPKFRSSSENDGEWPTCECLDKPWMRSGYVAEEVVSGFPVDEAHAQAYGEMRAHLYTSILSHQLEYGNPLKAYLMERGGLAASSL